MKAKVIIQHGEAEIVLTPENQFEKRLIEDGKKGNLENVSTTFRHKESNYGNRNEEHSITIRLSDRQQEPIKYATINEGP